MLSNVVTCSRLTRLSPVDALSSDAEMDELTMEAIESFAEKISASKDGGSTPDASTGGGGGVTTPEHGGAGDRAAASPSNLMSRLSPISLASEPPSGGAQQVRLGGARGVPVRALFWCR